LKTWTRKQARRCWGTLFVLPTFLFLLAFMIYPLLYSFYISLTDYNFVYDTAPKLAGLKNYWAAFADPTFMLALKNTFVFAGSFFGLVMLLSFGIALLLFYATRHAWFFRTSIFVPIVIPISLVCILFNWMFSENFGIINYLIGDLLRLPGLVHPWLTDGKTAMGVVVLVSLWSSIGFETILFLAGLQTLPGDMLEAAVVDGATGWRRIVHVILPNLKETYIITGIWAIIQGLKVFVQPMVLTQGGPGNATLVMYMDIYNHAFLHFDLGYAAAMAFILSVIILFFSMVNFKLNSLNG
jgi:ABC-type sugar transport system permease subunit